MKFNDIFKRTCIARRNRFIKEEAFDEYNRQILDIYAIFSQDKKPC